MNFPFYLAQRTTISGRKSFSKLIAWVAILTITLGVSVMILSVAILNGFKGEVTNKQRGFFGDILITRNNLNSSLESQPVDLNEARQAAIASLPGVIAVRKFATKPGIINVNGEVEGVVLKGIGADYEQAFMKSVLVSGDTLDFSDSTAVNGQILISQYTANRLRLDVGDDFVMYFVHERVRPRKFQVVGVFNTSSEELDKVYVVGALPLITRLNNWSDTEAGGYEVLLSDFDQLGPTTESVLEVLPIDLHAENLRSRFPQMFQWLDMLDANPRVILALMIIVAAINMISALLIIILERAQMIGILKTLGATNAVIRRVFMYHATYLIGIGLFFGNLLGLGLYFLQKSTHFLKLDEASYYVSYVPVEIGVVPVILINVSVLVISLLVLIIPSMLVSKLSPVRVIQFN